MHYILTLFRSSVLCALWYIYFILFIYSPFLFNVFCALNYMHWIWIMCIAYYKVWHSIHWTWIFYINIFHSFCTKKVSFKGWVTFINIINFLNHSLFHLWIQTPSLFCVSIVPDSIVKPHSYQCVSGTHTPDIGKNKLDALNP